MVSGRKRHVLVDTEGNLLKARVHPADIHDRAGAELLLAGLNAEFPRIALVWADTAYRGLKEWLAATLGWGLTISKLPRAQAQVGRGTNTGLDRAEPPHEP
jgi:putative transposase